MQIIPVIDILNGIAVHGVAGQRQRYRRIRSQLTESCDPSVLLRVFEQQFGLKSCYLADLDAIQFQQLNRCVLAELACVSDQLIVDRGVRTSTDIEELLELGVHRVVVALETLTSIHDVHNFVRQFGSERLILSIDLQNGQLLCRDNLFADRSPLSVAEELVAAGFSQAIVLDLASVGTSQGIPTLPLCVDLRKRLPDIQIITGGGICGVTDLLTLKNSQVDGVLLATSLHTGQITASDLAEL